MAGDELTWEEANQVFKQKLGYEMPLLPRMLALLGKKLVGEIDIMLKWYNVKDFEFDIPKIKRLHPGLLTFGDWLEKQRKFDR